MQSKKKQEIIEAIKEMAPLLNSFEQIYLFGSILDANKPSCDIDILIVYSKYTIDTKLEIKEFCDIIEKKANLPVDLTVLSLEEMKETKFLNRIKANYKIK